MPEILVHDSDVYVGYISEFVAEPDSGHALFAVVRFCDVLQHTFGYPNDEALQGHPLYAFGLEFYCFNEIHSSPTVRELASRNESLFPGSAKHYLKYNHWVVTFHDETLEVIAKSIAFLGTVSAKSAHAAILARRPWPVPPENLS
jgi:hypothetical protein